LCAWSNLYASNPSPRFCLKHVAKKKGNGHNSHRPLENLKPNFIGNVEGHDFFTGKADVIVCDGFVGNILLKFNEGMVQALALRIETVLQGNLAAPLQDYTTILAEVLRTIGGQTVLRGAPPAGRQWSCGNRPRRFKGRRRGSCH